MELPDNLFRVTADQGTNLTPSKRNSPPCQNDDIKIAVLRLCERSGRADETLVLNPPSCMGILGNLPVRVESGSRDREESERNQTKSVRKIKPRDHCRTKI